MPFRLYRTEEQLEGKTGNFTPLLIGFNLFLKSA